MIESPRFDHLVALTDRYGTFEHAEHATPRREHGYCVDDVARVLVVSAREPRPNASVRSLAQGSMAFVAEAMGPRGECRNRRSADGSWTSEGSTEDCWGRSLWGLGTAAACSQFAVAGPALVFFERAAAQRSQYPRSMAFAVLGAAAVLGLDPRNVPARSLMDDAVDAMFEVGADPAWPWPEPRLYYANALLPDAMMLVSRKPEIGISGKPSMLIITGGNFSKATVARQRLTLMLSTTILRNTGVRSETRVSEEFTLASRT